MAHSHHHEHHTTASQNIAVAFFLNLSFTIIELVGGLITNSMAILSDAIHDLGDSIAIGLSWYMEKVAKKAPNAKYSYGYRRFSLIGAMVNALLLFVGSSFVIYTCVGRIIHPQPVSAQGMLWLAILGVIINGAAVLRTSRGKGINEKMISLHLLEDVLGWVAVLIVSIVMLFVDVPILDPILSIAISLYVLYNVVCQMLQTFNVILQGVPMALDVHGLRKELITIPHIIEVHDLHIWSLDSEYNIATMHVVVDSATLSPDERLSIRNQVKEMMKTYGVEHTTVEMELQGQYCTPCDAHSCSLEQN